MTRHPDSVAGAGVGPGRYAIRVGKLFVQGFRYPPGRHEVGKSDNVVRDNEVRAAASCIAMLGDGQVHCAVWHIRESAEFSAGVLGGEVVELPKEKKR